MPRIPKGMTKEEYRDQRALQGKVPKDAVSIRVEPMVYKQAKDFCEKRGLSFSKLVNTLLKHHLTTEGEGISDRRYLVAASRKLWKEIAELRKMCGSVYPQIREAYKALGGLGDGSNCEEVFPRLYNHLSGVKGARARIPFFEDYLRFKIQYQQILEALEKVEKVEK